MAIVHAAARRMNRTMRGQRASVRSDRVADSMAVIDTPSVPNGLKQAVCSHRITQWRPKWSLVGHTGPMGGASTESDRLRSDRSRREVSLYDLFGVEAHCSADDLRNAYRQMARRLHPDVAGLGDGGAAMAKLNEAWRILSDPETRQRYDLTLDLRSSVSIPHSTQPPPRAQWSRRQAWVIGIQAQMARLTRQAGRSATQTLLVRVPRAQRDHYEALVERIVASVCEDTEPRVRAARAAGAAPLDLASAASLIALRSLADRLRRESALGVNADVIMTAELIDRMWDIMAHELTSQLAAGLGGNPHVAHAIGVR